MLLCIHAVRGQGGVALEGSWGYNTHFGQWGAAAVSARHAMPRHFQIRGGVRIISYPAFAADLRPAYFHELNCGRITAGPVVSWLHQSGTDNICAGIGAGMQMRHWSFSLGWYHRTIRAAGYRRGLTEPSNLLYEIAANVMPPEHRWNILAAITNSALTAVERAYQPTVALTGVWHPSTHTGIWLRAEYKPAGVFNMSHNYYQSSLNLGFEYAW